MTRENLDRLKSIVDATSEQMGKDTVLDDAGFKILADVGRTITREVQLKDLTEAEGDLIRGYLKEVQKKFSKL